MSQKRVQESHVNNCPSKSKGSHSFTTNTNPTELFLKSSIKDNVKPICQTVLMECAGLAHLEALEMLSNRSERKVQSLLSAMEEDMLENIRPQLVEIKDTFQQAFEKEEAGGCLHMLVITLFALLSLLSCMEFYFTPCKSHVKRLA